MKRLFQGLALGALLVAPAAAFAQDAEAEVTVPAAAEEPAVNAGNLRLTGGIDYTTAYFFRGYNQEDQGLILQPYVNIYFDLVKGDNPISAYIGTWNSFHEEKTGADSDTFGSWYESDLVVGVDATLGSGFTVGTVYTLYTYPNGAFDTIEEIGFKVGYDDTDKLGIPFALKPYAGIYFETDDQNGTEDTYLEVGIVPTVYTYNEGGDRAISLSVPIAVGMGIDDYYFDDSGDDEFLGYGSIGLAASMPLASGNYGAWTLNASVTWLQFFADGLEDVNHGDNSEIIGKVGVSFAY